MHLTGELVPVEQLYGFGGIYRIVPEDVLVETAQAVARKIVRHSPLAVAVAKRSLNTIEYLNLKEGYEFEQSLTSALAGFADSKEAVNAVVEHREPRYTTTTLMVDELFAAVEGNQYSLRDESERSLN
jgi:enoyl-CoA hydratase